MKNVKFKSGALGEARAGTSPSSPRRTFRQRYAAPLANNPLRQMQQTKAHLRQIINNLEGDLGNVTEAKAKALFETAVAALARVVKAFDDYENKFKSRG